MAELIVAGLIILAGFYSRMSQNSKLRDILSIMPELCLIVLIASLINVLLGDEPVTFDNYIADLEAFTAMKFAFIYLIVNFFKIRRKGIAG